MTPDTAKGTRARRAARSSSAGESNRSDRDQPPGGSSEPQEETAASSRSRGGSARRDLDPDVLAALEEERDFLLRSLDDLEREHDAGDLDDDDYAALKDDYTARAAAAIRAVERREQAAREVPRRSRRALVITVGTALALVVLAGWFVISSARDRAPGDTTTGDIRESSLSEIVKARQYTAEAMQAQDGDAALDAFRNALDSYSKALEIQPNNVEAMTYRGWLLHTVALAASADAADSAAQLDAEALQSLDKAISTDPTYPDARVFRAILYQRAGRIDDALADLDAIAPGAIPPEMSSMVQQLRDQLAASTASSSSTAPAAQTGG